MKELKVIGIKNKRKLWVFGVFGVLLIGIFLLINVNQDLNFFLNEYYEICSKNVKVSEITFIQARNLLENSKELNNNELTGFFHFSQDVGKTRESINEKEYYLISDESCFYDLIIKKTDNSKNYWVKK